MTNRPTTLWWRQPWLSPLATILTIVLTIVCTWVLWAWVRPMWSARKITASVGQTLTLGGLALTVTSPRQIASDPPFVPANNAVYKLVTVTVRNSTATPVQLIPLLQFHLFDDQGHSFPLVSLPSTSAQLSGPIPPLERIREDLAFEVPSTAQGLRLWFEPGTTGQEIGIIQLPVWR